jgi:hypothetical protein
LRTLDDFEIVALSSRTNATADSLVAEFGIRHAFDDHHDLIADPEVDLVVILAPGPEHARAYQGRHRWRQGRLQQVAAADHQQRGVRGWPIGPAAVRISLRGAGARHLGGAPERRYMSLDRRRAPSGSEASFG